MTRALLLALALLTACKPDADVDDTGLDSEADTELDTDAEPACASVLLTALDETDADGDGVFESGQLWTYTVDAHGNPLTSELDRDNDGTVDYRVAVTRTADGLPVTEIRDYNNDGVIEWFGTYTHAADGTVSRLVIVNDTNNDGAVDATNTITYDSNGYVEREEVDTTGDGTANEVSTYDYDADGNWLDYTKDFENDGIIDVHYAMTYNANGDITWALGSYGSTSEYTYNADGCLIEQDYDSFGDGNTDILWTYTCDSDARIVLEEMDYGFDGAINRRIAWEFDERDNITQYEYEDRQPGAVTGTPNYRTNTTYNAANQQLREERDDDANGTIDSWTEREYDARGNLTRVTAGGEQTYTQLLTYDDYGNNLTYSFDASNDGTIDARGTYTYDTTDCE